MNMPKWESPLTVCIDLDGTILEYDWWRGETHFGAPIEGAREAQESERTRIVVPPS